ncbi:MAG: type I DNA topoisomerase [Alphaproteobacteria bacterium]
MDIVVVESPAKARTLGKYLGPDYRVLPSYGHVCDLPAKDGSVRPEEDFAMTYATEPKAKKHLKAIADAVKGAHRLYLATDPDREGEAISWHVVQELQRRRALEGVEVRRVVFHEITSQAVLAAMRIPRDVDMDLVNAQQARRALDYLVGFTLSPVLWRKLPGSRSAGRVQSVALRLVCAREAEIEAFTSQEHWTVDVDFETPRGDRLTARLVRLNGQKLEKFDLADEAAAKAAAAKIEALSFAVTGIDRTKARRRPQPPFITSTLQQEASRKLGFSARRTAEIAQRLYEGVNLGGETVGLITYMRTDSTKLAPEAVAACRALIERDFGAPYLPSAPRTYRSSAKNAQEAHEAIRPTMVDRRPDAVARFLKADQLRLYELIWKRTVASQMASAEFDKTAIEIASPDGAVGLRATGSVVAFDGFLGLYEEGRDDDAGDEAEGKALPEIKEGEALAREAVRPAQHFTEPSPRFSEASLVKRLEELGIGRPSTYATILSVLQDRAYVRLEKRRFVPEERGRLVTAFLESFFERYVEYDFTAELEDKLDQVSNGKVNWKAVLRDFWDAFSLAVAGAERQRPGEMLAKLEEALAPHIFPDDGKDKDPRACPACREGHLSLKLGRFGAFVGCSKFPACRYSRPVAADEATTQGGEGASEGPRPLGRDAASGEAVTLRRGPYGNYVQLGEGADNRRPKRVALPETLAPGEVDLETALALLALPREVGRHPETGMPVLAGIGRYGPYLSHDGTFASLGRADDVLTIGLNRAVALLAEAKENRRTAKPVTLRVIGNHPDDDKPINLMKGRYGPYLQHDGVNAPVPKGASLETMTVAEAVVVLKARRRRRARKTRSGAGRGRRGSRKVATPAG